MACACPIDTSLRPGGRSGRSKARAEVFPPEPTNYFFFRFAFLAFLAFLAIGCLFQLVLNNATETRRADLRLAV